MNKSLGEGPYYNPYINERAGPYFKKHLDYVSRNKAQQKSRNQSYDGFGMLGKLLSDPKDGSPGEIELKSYID